MFETRGVAKVTVLFKTTRNFSKIYVNIYKLLKYNIYKYR